jgi:hypothetical protein
MDLISTPVGLFTFMSLLLTFIVGARVLPLGALSLPCMTAITSVIYFYLMPAISLANGIDEFLGMNLKSLVWAHWSVFLYIAGAATAFFVQSDVLLADPSVPSKVEPEMNLFAFNILWVLAVVGLISQIVPGGALEVIGHVRFADVQEQEDRPAFLFVNFQFCPCDLGFERKPVARKKELIESFNAAPRPANPPSAILKIFANFGLTKGFATSGAPGVKPTKMEACEPKVKLAGAIARYKGPIAFIFGA